MYFPLLAWSLLSLHGLVVAQDTNLTDVKNAFIAAKIPSNLNIEFNPTVLLEVPQNATGGPPIFTIRGDGKGPFVVIAVDPDAPTPQGPTLAQIRHFLGGNFAPDPSTFVLSNSTPAISNWIQPSPPAGSDAHRYIFLLFNQPTGFNDETLVASTTNITNFNVSTFATATNLGAPIGGTFMLVAPDAGETPASRNTAISSRVRDTGSIIFITVVTLAFVL